MHRPPERQTKEEWLRAYDGENVTQMQPSVTVNKTRSQHDNLDEGVVEEKALIPKGKYSAWYSSHELHKNFKGYGDKMVVSFCVDDCEHAGEIVSAFYNITITEKGWKTKGGSRWVKEMRRLFPDRKRKDRLPVSLLKNKKVLIEVRTVITGKAKRVLDKEEKYSVVDDVLRLLN